MTQTKEERGSPMSFVVQAGGRNPGGWKRQNRDLLKLQAEGT